MRNHSDSFGLEGGAEVALISPGTKDEKQPRNGDETMREETSNKVRLAKNNTIPSKKRARAPVPTDAVGLEPIGTHPKTVLRDLTLIGNGIMEPKYNTPFWVYTSNFKYMPVIMPKHTTAGPVRSYPRAILQFDQHLDEEQVEPANGQKGDDTTTHWESRVQI